MEENIIKRIDYMRDLLKSGKIDEFTVQRKLDNNISYAYVRGKSGNTFHYMYSDSEGNTICKKENI